MALIEPLTDYDDRQRDLLVRSLRGPDGEFLNVFRTLVRQPELMRRINALGGYFFVASSLPVRDRELVVLRVAAATRSAYEEGQHRWLAAEAGLAGDEIAAALGPRSGHQWDDRDRLLLEFVDELLAEDRAEPDRWHALAPYFDDAERLELTVLVGYYRLLAGVLNTVGVELDDAVADLLAAEQA